MTVLPLQVVKEPFTQLVSVHAFVAKEDVVKQEPLCFLLMSGRKRSDYVAVLHKVVDLLPSPPRLQQVVSDFERALWKATRQVSRGIDMC